MQYVREAKVAQPSGKASQKGTANDLSETTFKSEDSQQIDIPCGDEDVDSDAWVEPNESIEQEETPPLPHRPVPNANLSLSERIVMVSTSSNMSSSDFLNGNAGLSTTLASARATAPYIHFAAALPLN